MKHYAGLDVSVKETSICIVDETGKVCRELKVPSHPEDLLRVLQDPALNLVRVGLEAGPLSQWLFNRLTESGLPLVCIETRHARAYLKAQVNKTDRNDARGIAQMMRVNLFRPVHVKTLASQKQRALLTARKLLQSKAIAIDNDIRGLLRNFGLKVGVAGAAKFEQRIRELVEDLPDLSELMEVLLEARRTLREQYTKLHKKLLAIVRDDNVCRRLMTIPGVGAVTALAYRATIDVPARFRNSKVRWRRTRAHACPASVGGDEPRRADLFVRRRNDACAALRRCPGRPHPQCQMVMAQSLGHDHRQEPRSEEGNRSAGAQACRHHAPHLG